MTGAVPRTAAGGALTKDAMPAFVGAAGGWFAVLVALRILEWARLRANYAGVRGAAAAVPLGMLADVRYATVATLILAIPFAAMARWSARGALLVHRAFLTLLAVAGAALIQYFVTTGVLLGADLWGYTLSDITTTVGASSGGIGQWLVLAVTATATWIVTGQGARIAMPGAPRKLQADPTIIYGCVVPVVKSKACQKFDGRIRRIQLNDAENPYNTYQREGLPPGPIGNPGRAALEAVFAPETSAYLYFVSRNDGSHAFARNEVEHNANVRRYQLGQRTAPATPP